MPSPSTTTRILHPNKHHASSLINKTASNRQEVTKKAAVAHPPPQSPREDFILFPDDPIIEKNSTQRRARARAVKAELIADGLLPSSRDGQVVAETPNLTPLQRRTRRHAKVEKRPIIHQDVEPQWRETKLPPAPSPPRLGTPELDDFDEDLWSCCRFSDSSVESAEAYIAASIRQQEKPQNSRSSTS